LSEIKVAVNISDSTKDTVKVVEETANKNNYQIVVKPIEFTITATSGDKTVDVEQFNAYVERTVAIPDGVDPKKITTGIVLNNDGTFSHVPTMITVINGKYFAKINSLTNSTYSVIYSPKTFKDVEKHWAKSAVNNMGSRLVIEGRAEDTFAPKEAITRAEFAAVLVRALGLKHVDANEKVTFKDVSANDWYDDDVQIAVRFGLISGYSDGTFQGKRTISREEVAVMIARAMKWTQTQTLTDQKVIDQSIQRFTDANVIANWSRTAVASLIANGILQGKDKGKLHPKVNITRAETASMMERFLQHAGLID
jgi:hypothetical protein